MDTIENALFVGKVLYNLPETESTNLHALDLLSSSRPVEGTVVSTSFQTRGRGQTGNSWVSERNKNITLSIIFYPVFLNPGQQFYLNMALALAVRDLLSSYTKKTVKVKWSNDLYVEEQKIGGILIQNQLSQNKIQASVFGLGLNINQKQFPEELPNPVSLSLITDSECIIDEVKSRLFKKVEQRYLQLKSGNLNQIKTDYLEHLYRFMEDHLYLNLKEDKVFQGKIIGIENAGRLKILHQNGEEAFEFQQIRFL